MVLARYAGHENTISQVILTKILHPQMATLSLNGMTQRCFVDFGLTRIIQKDIIQL